MIRLIISWLLLTTIHAEINQCTYSRQFVKAMHGRVPHKLAADCIRKIESKKSETMVIGALIGILLAPLAIPLFAAAGLSGAALTASGLATLGGGAIAAGGGGMLLGSIVLYGSAAISGGLILGTTISSEHCEIPTTSYNDVIYDNTGKIIYHGSFRGTTPTDGWLWYIDNYIALTGGVPGGC